jgi:hypothetical protein
MIHLDIQLNGAQLASSQEDEGVLSIEIIDHDNPPVFVVKDMQSGWAETFFLAYKDGTWVIDDFSHLTDLPS